MKNKIEINQSDMLSLLVEKVNFLLSEYRNLHSAFKYNGKGRVKTDPVVLSQSYENFLKEEGDIIRILKLVDLFDEKPEKIVKRVKKELKTEKPKTDELKTE